MSDEPQALSAGSQVERFTVTGAFATGASSITYRAQDSRTGTGFLL